MFKNELAKAQKREFTEVSVIVNDADKKTKLQNYIDEAIRCKTRILDERESIKGIRDAATQDLNLDPKMFGNLVKLFFNNNFEEKKKELELLDDAISALMQVDNNL